MNELMSKHEVQGHGQIAYNLRHSSIRFYVIIRVHSGFSLVENCDVFEDRRTLTPFQRQANHSNFRIIDSQWRALFCVDHDHVKWRAKVFSSHYKAHFGNIFLHFNYIKQIDNILPLSVQL